MHFLTGKALPRRTFLKGAGATIALPLLDSMFAAGRLGASPLADRPTRLVCIEEVHGVPGLQRVGSGAEPLCAGDGGQRLRTDRRQRAEGARTVAEAADDRQQYRRAHGGGVRGPGGRRRPLPLQRRFPDAIPPQTDPRAPTSSAAPRWTSFMRSASGRRPRCHRCSCASSGPTRAGVATTTTRARTRTRSAGRRRRSRCR